MPISLIAVGILLFIDREGFIGFCVEQHHILGVDDRVDTNGKLARDGFLYHLACFSVFLPLKTGEWGCLCWVREGMDEVEVLVGDWVFNTANGVFAGVAGVVGDFDVDLCGVSGCPSFVVRRV